MQIWGCQNPQAPEPIDMKFGVGNYVGEITLLTEIQKDRPGGGVPAYGWNITFAWFNLFLWPKNLLAFQG